MTTDLDRAIRSSLGDIIATAPEPDDLPMRVATIDSETRPRRPYLAVAASLVVVAGVGALVAINANDAAPVAPAEAPIATDESLEPAQVTVATTTTLAGATASSAVVNTTPSCASASTPALVPNVAGLPWVDAAAMLEAARLGSNALPELPGPAVEATDADLYVTVRQDTAPGTITPCGTTVDIIVAYRPGILHIVQEGDSFESIAASQGLTLDELLVFNGLSVAELEEFGQSPSAPLALGQALRLGPCPASGACSGPSTASPTLNDAPATTTTTP